MGIKLRRAGIPFTILEKGDRVGGVWRDNTYPGAACDIPSHLYSYSFEPSHDWSRKYGSQPEIQAYLDHCAHKYVLMQHIRFGAAVQRADFDPTAATWTVTLADGNEVCSSFLVAATGQLSLPADPSFPGLDRFEGKVFHSARWDHDYDLRGKRVAVIGTGASAIQFVPQIAPRAAQLHVFQRSAPYVLPKPDRPYTRLVPNLFLLYGPNTNLGHNSIIYMLESQTDYVLEALRHAATHGARWLDVRPEAHREFNEELQGQLRKTVWQAGCDSWYVTEAGKNTNNWPSFTFDYRRQTRFFDPVQYVTDADSQIEPLVAGGTEP
ncbi:MAG: NAD(P)/FAD-dependent oxidoreductase [Phycisphaerae bacterium]|nr:NAD(P)/FAD-dependent oxidoreductase [Phycisphaerae bacterium]